jgi:hypothetical protein
MGVLRVDLTANLVSVFSFEPDNPLEPSRRIVAEIVVQHMPELSGQFDIRKSF